MYIYDQQLSSGQVGYFWFLGEGLGSLDDFPNLMGTTLVLNSSLINFHEDVICSYENIKKVIIPLSIGGGLSYANDFQSIM